MVACILWLQISPVFKGNEWINLSLFTHLTERVVMGNEFLIWWVPWCSCWFWSWRCLWVITWRCLWVIICFWLYFHLSNVAIIFPCFWKFRRNSFLFFCCSAFILSSIAAIAFIRKIYCNRWFANMFVNLKGRT